MAKRASLATLSDQALARELARRQRSKGKIVVRLQKKRAALAARLHALDREIARHGGAVRGGQGRRVRPKNDLNLVDALSKLLKGQTMRVTEIVVAVQKAGYRTTSPNFRTIVNQTLLNKEKFKRVGRGRYTAK